MTRVWIDFNDATDDDGVFATLVKYADAEVWVGSPVTVFDHDGNEADAVVERVSGELLALRVDLSTFRDGQPTNVHRAAG